MILSHDTHAVGHVDCGIAVSIRKLLVFSADRHDEIANWNCGEGVLSR